MELKPKNNQNTNQATQTAGQTNMNSNFTAVNSNLEEFEHAFGHVHLNDRAAVFCNLIDQKIKESPNSTHLKAYGVYRIGRLCTAHGSAVAISKYDQQTDKTVVSVIYFENDESLILSADSKGVETYDSTISRIDASFSNAVIEQLANEHGIHNAVYQTANIVPSDINLTTVEQALGIMSQLLISTFGRRRGTYGSMVVDATENFVTNVTSFSEDAVQDPNGLPQRADLGIKLTNTKTQKDTTVLTLTTDNEVRQYNSTSLAYVNMRYTGLQEDQVNRGADAKLNQITAELVVTLSNSPAHSAMERQLFMLGSWARIAQQGAWRGPFIDRLGSDRKLGDVARHMRWCRDTSKVDFGQFDKTAGGKDLFLDTFVHDTAAIVMSHRIGNGIGGLSSVFADLCEPATAAKALENLVALLDGMFPAIKSSDGKQIHRPKFSNVLMDSFGTNNISVTMFINNMVPTISGSYKGSNGPRSLDDMDLIKVCTYFGDKFTDVKAYVETASLQNRFTDPKQTRIRLMKFADEIYGGNTPRYTGEAVHIILNPIFLEVLANEINQRARHHMNGASNYVKEENSLFLAGNNTSYVVKGVGRGNTSSEYGTTSINGGSIF